MGELIPLMMLGIFIIIAVDCFRSMMKDRGAKQKCVPVITEADYIYKLARLAKTSEYEVFKKTAENWPVSQAMIERDFDKYLDGQAAPYYVSHFIQENKKHLDEIKMPYFWN